MAGRWNSIGSKVIYASASAALAYLEILANLAPGEHPGKLLLVEIEIPDSLILKLPRLPKGWDAIPVSPASRKAGDLWLRGQASVALKVPSVIVPTEWNVLISPTHPTFDLDWAGEPQPFSHDARLRKLTIT